MTAFFPFPDPPFPGPRLSSSAACAGGECRGAGVAVDALGRDAVGRPCHAVGVSNDSSRRQRGPAGQHDPRRPGVYLEAVTVSTTNLTILGGQIHARGESGPSIVETTGVAFTLEANNIQLSHFTIEPPANSSGTAGVEITAGSGDLVQDNLIESESTGIGVDTDDLVAISSVTINDNTVEQASMVGIDVIVTGTVNLSGNTTNNDGTGIDVESPTARATVISNKVNNNSVIGVIVFASSVTYQKNTTDDDGSGVELETSSATSSAMVSGNVADDDGFGFFY